MKQRLFALFAALCLAAGLASAALAQAATPETAAAPAPEPTQTAALPTPEPTPVPSAQTGQASAAGFVVSAAAAPGALPETARLNIRQPGAEAPPPLQEYGTRAAALDIGFYQDETEIEPEGTVQVSIQLPPALAADLQQLDDPIVVHRKAAGETTIPEVVAQAEDFSPDRTSVTFAADSFSLYEFYGTEKPDAPEPDEPTKEEPPQEPDTPEPTGTDAPDALDTPERQEDTDLDEEGEHTAAIYYLATPDGIPGSNDTQYWEPTSDTSTLYATINTTGAVWRNNKNIVTNVSSYITEWPDGTTGSTWTVTRDDSSAGDDFTYILDSIWEAYASKIQSDTGVQDLKKEDVTEITLEPFKISRNNSSTPNQYYHVDCIISVKSSQVFTAKFWVQQPGAAEYELVDAKNYRTAGKVQQTTAAVIGTTKTVNGINYVLDGWYAEQDGGPYGPRIESWPYQPTGAELADGTVNFYAHYTAITTSLTVSKTVSGALGDKTKAFAFTLTATAPDGTPVRGIKITGNSNEELTSGTNFTLKSGQSITFTNIPTGSTVTVEEADYTTADGYTTLYSIDGAPNVQGRRAVLARADAAGHTIAFTNNKDVAPDTGTALHSQPYAALLAAVLAAGLACLHCRKRGCP